MVRRKFTKSDLILTTYCEKSIWAVTSSAKLSMMERQMNAIVGSRGMLFSVRESRTKLERQQNSSAASRLALIEKTFHSMYEN